MKKMYLKLTSLLLVTVMTLCVFPLTASATDAEAPQKEATVTEATSQVTEETEAWQRIDNETHQVSLGYDNPDTPRHITEIESRREENVKHFILPDGSVEAIVYGTAVHRKDAAGEWKDIDNTLSANNAKAPNLYVTDDLRAVFAKSFSSNGQLFALNENGYGISMKLIANSISLSPMEPISAAAAAVASEVTVTNAETRSDKKEWNNMVEAVRVDNASSIRYSNVKANTDLEYVLDGNNVKENIIIKSAGGSYVYTFELELSGLAPALREDGSISLSDVDTGDTEYIIPAPYMFDASGEYSYNVYYTLTEKSEGVYALKITADSEWINAENREFPVTVDPTITSNCTMDTYIDSNAPSSTHGSLNELWVSSTKTAYIHRSLPNIPSNSTLKSVKLYVAYYYYDNVTSNTLTASAYQVNIGWTESSLTWNSANNYYNLGTTTTALSSASFSGSAGAYASSPKWVSFDITSAANNWMSGVINNGIAIKRISGTNGSVILKSSETGSYCPYISVTYLEPRIADGVYKIRNIGTDTYVDTTEGGTAAGTQLQQWTGLPTYGTRNQLYKITFINVYDNINYYTIRPLTNCGQGMNIPAVGGTVTLEDLPTTDTWGGTPWNQSIGILDVNSGYVIKSGNDLNSQYLTAPSSGENGTKLYSSSTLSNNSIWELIPYTTPIDGAIFTGDFARYLIPNETFTYSAVMFSTTIGRNGPVTYSVRNTDATLTDKATINTSTGELTALETGTIWVCASYPGTTDIWAREVEIEEDMSDTYFIKNAQLSNYMQIDDSVENWDGGESLELWNFDGNTHQKWDLEYISEGYYKILSTACGLAATAPSELEEKVLQNPYTGANNQRWRFVDEGGNYSIVPKSSMANYLSAGFGVLITGGRNVTLREEQDDNKDRWYLLDTHLTFPIRLLYDSTVIKKYNPEEETPDDITEEMKREITEAKIAELFNDAVVPFANEFNIHFEIVSIEYSSDIELPECQSEDMCHGSCGEIEECDAKHHHGAGRIIDIDTSNDYHTCRLVGYSLCWYDPSNPNLHTVIDGLGNINGNNSVINVNSSSGNPNTVIPHELSHNFGTVHHYHNNANCIMNTYDVQWCNGCRKIIYDTISSYYTYS